MGASLTRGGKVTYTQAIEIAGAGGGCCRPESAGRKCSESWVQQWIYKAA